MIGNLCVYIRRCGDACPASSPEIREFVRYEQSIAFYSVLANTGAKLWNYEMLTLSAA